MGNFFSEIKESPVPPIVLVPPLFDFPPLAARTRMLESSYNLLFGKLALRCLFDDYFEEARNFSTRIMLKPIDDPHVDFIATVSGPLEHKPEETIVGNAEFRWQSDLDDPHTFVDLFVSSADPILRLRSCAYYPKYGFGAFGIFPVLLKNRESYGDNSMMGLRYGSANLSFGTSFMPLLLGDDIPKSAWLVSKMGRLTAGVQYEPHDRALRVFIFAMCGSLLNTYMTSPNRSECMVNSYDIFLAAGCIVGTKDGAKYKNLANWSCAVGYGVGSGSPLSPSFSFCLELAKNSKFIASFYQHVVVQRRVKSPTEENEVVGITNYMDFGFELETSVNSDKAKGSGQDSTFQVAASWQANKNFLLKGKVGPLCSSFALAFKSWWNPAFTFNISAKRERADGKTALGFGIRVDNVREASYQRANPNYAMLTPNKEHLAEGIQWETGEKPMMKSDVTSENFNSIPKELRPLAKIL